MANIMARSKDTFKNLNGADKAAIFMLSLEQEQSAKLFEMMKNYPDLKSKGSSKAITMVKPLDRQEYEVGKIVEWKRGYIRQINI